MSNIESYLRIEKEAYKAFEQEPKLLVLGSSDSGKSTLLKQLKIIHGGGFSEKEKIRARNGILNTSIFAINLLLDLTFNDEKLMQYIPIRVLGEEWTLKSHTIPVEVAILMKEAWYNPAVQISYKTMDTIHRLPSTTEYFLDNWARCSAENFVPTNEDILMLRTVTQSVIQHDFTVKGSKIHFYDVSGLVHHRKNWLSYFSDVHSVMFVASLSCYNQTMVEDSSVNQMSDSLLLFEQMVNHKLLVKKDVVLFLNKRDIFEKKAKQILIKDHFPAYEDKPYSLSQGAKFFSGLFKAKIKRPRFVHVHVTQATDTRSMNVIVTSLFDSIITENLQDAGIML